MADFFLENPRCSPYLITDENKIPFSSVEYSRFKHGITSRIHAYAAELVSVFLDRINTKNGHIKVQVYSSPYDHIPTPSLLLAREFMSQLKSVSRVNGLISIREGKILRNYTYTENYAKLDRDSRLRLISGDTYSLNDVIQEDELLIFIDDISVTGSHQYIVEKLLRDNNVKNEKIFLYYAVVDQQINPELENKLNESAIDNSASIANIINHPEFTFVTRIIKRILTMREPEFDSLFHSIKFNRISFWQSFLDMAIKNKYQDIAEYYNNVEKIKNRISDYLHSRQTILLFFLLLFLGSCNFSIKDETINEDIVEASENQSKVIEENVDAISVEGKVVKPADLNKRKIIKLGHHINTFASEYFPLLSADQSYLVFSAMDRTGYFDFKLDFTKSKSSGGEDIFVSELSNGLFTDARPIEFLNTNGHECANFIFPNGDLLVSANYPEKLGPKSNDKGLETTDIFLARRQKDGYQLLHLPEPVNSIYTESDAFSDNQSSFILFVSDRPGHVGEYHKKGWRWNDNLWGNTDVYVCLKDGDEWQASINLGPIVNSPAAERTPWLSPDGLTLYLSSNGYKEGRVDMDVFYFKRVDRNNWTSWTGPFELNDINSDKDDWGYKEYQDGRAIFARARSKPYKSTQEGVNGDGYIRETNYRSGYQLYGAQSAALFKDENTDIFMCLPEKQPAFILPDILFKFDSYQLTLASKKTFDRLLDLCNENKDKKVLFVGHTDNLGSEEYNMQLSTKRSKAVMEYLVGAGMSNSCMAIGKGKSSPITSNSGEAGRKKNRRVEVYFE